MGLPKPKRNIQEWQDKASRAIGILHGTEGKEASIFKCFKDDTRSADIALADCKELGKLNALYFFKVYNQLTNRKT